MIDRKPFENGSNPGREREEAVLRGVSGWLEPSEPRLARWNGISSAFRSRHMGNVGLTCEVVHRIAGYRRLFWHGSLAPCTPVRNRNVGGSIARFSTFPSPKRCWVHST
jgi:hypothetical protein